MFFFVLKPTQLCSTLTPDFLLRKHSWQFGGHKETICSARDRVEAFHVLHSSLSSTESTVFFPSIFFLNSNEIFSHIVSEHWAILQLNLLPFYLKIILIKIFSFNMPSGYVVIYLTVIYAKLQNFTDTKLIDYNV